MVIIENPLGGRMPLKVRDGSDLDGILCKVVAATGMMWRVVGNREGMSV